MQHHFEGNPLQAEDYCTIHKLELVIPDGPRDNSETLGISDVIDLMVMVATASGENAYRLGVEFKDAHGEVVQLSVSIYWSNLDTDANGKPHRNYAGFIYYHVQVSIVPLSDSDTVMILGYGSIQGKLFIH